MTDRMDQLIRALTHLGWEVRQTRTGAWRFRKGTITVTAARTPETADEWMALLDTLRGAELGFRDNRK